MKKSRIALVIVLLGWFACNACFAQVTANYDGLVQEGKAQLQAGNNDAALASANAAIQLDATRWEAYAVAGGALINLKRCSEAETELNEAITRAPEAKQSGLVGLVQQCQNKKSVPSALDFVLSRGPTLAETSDWLAKTMETYGGNNSNDVNFYEVIKDVHIDNCIFSYTSVTPHLDKHEKQNGWDTDHIEVALNQLVPGTVTFFEGGGVRGTGGVSLQSAGQQTFVKIDGRPLPRGSFEISVQTSPHGVLPDGTVPQRPGDMVPRLINAFQRAVSVCRTMSPPVPQPKQPF